MDLKSAFLTCLIVYLVGVALLLLSGSSLAVSNFRTILDFIGLAALILGGMLLWRRFGPELQNGSAAKLQSSASRIDKRLIAIPVAGIGAFFIASALQTGHENWAGQLCYRAAGCWHPEWVALGVGLIGLAIYLWKLQTPKSPLE